MTTTRRQSLIYRVSGYPGVRERKVAKDKTKPGTPTGLAAEIVSSSIVDLTWHAASDPVVPGQSTSGVKGYRVFRNSTRIADLGPVLTYTDTGRTPGATYRYAVASVDNRNNQSVLSPQVAVTMPTVEPPPVEPDAPDTTAPTVPAGLNAVVQGQMQINLTWSASTDPTVAGQVKSGVAGYKVYRDGAQVAIVALVPSYQDTGLEPGTGYSYRVSAVDVAGNESAQSAADSATTTAEPGEGGEGETINAASASREHVLAAIAQANAGDTVVVPAGSASWLSGITISGITLRGPGQSAGSPCNITAGMVTITKHATHVTRLLGFRFTGTLQHFTIGGALNARAFVVDDCRFQNAGAVMGRLTTNGGLFSRCTFVAAPAHGSDVFAANLGVGSGSAGNASWAAAPSLGTLDTTGETNTYFEDCTWSGFLEVALDIDDGARVVVRHCTLTDSSFVCHGGGSGTSGNDSSSYGNKHFECYDNTFDRVSNSVAINKWCWWRGGGGVFVDNAIDEASSPDGSSYPNKPELRLTVSCPGPYPLAYQVGQVVQSPENPPSKPLLIYGNTGTGSSSGNFIAIGANPFGGCGNPGSYIQAGRDYQTSNTWGWTKYPYPHPLRP